MLTRTQVAQRLGKSVATVRRMEGDRLYPWVDENGVHRFDPDEVEEVRARVAVRGSIDSERSQWLESQLERDGDKARDDGWGEDAETDAVEDDLRRRLARAETALEEQRLAFERKEAKLGGEHEKHLEFVTGRVCEFIDSLRPGEVQRIGYNKLEALLCLPCTLPWARSEPSGH